MNAHLVYRSWLNTKCLILTQYLLNAWKTCEIIPKFIQFTKLMQCGLTLNILLYWSPTIIPAIDLGEMSLISMICQTTYLNICLQNDFLQRFKSCLFFNVNFINDKGLVISKWQNGVTPKYDQFHIHNEENI